VEERELGASGVAVSRIVLGLGNVGGIGSAPELFGVAGESEEEALVLMDAAWAAGITTFDTAASYGGGRSERAIGTWLDARGLPAVVATKVFHSVDGDPHDFGLAPERIRRELTGSLGRLAVERVDLYLIHEPDLSVPLADTLEALDELVRRGTVGAIGASNVDGAYLEEALAISAERGLARFEWVQNSYSLLDREPERDVFPICEREGLGFTPFSPLAGGWLTGKYRRGEPYPPGSRMTLRPGPYAPFEADEIYDALEAFEAEALARGVDPAALALAWVLSHPTVTAAVVGPRQPSHLEPALAALELELSPAERDELTAIFDAAIRR
jgi:aryl-alcohol dehydrogenase-like predicted oxidoreductase